MRGSIKELGLGKRGENLQKEKCGIDTMVIEKCLKDRSDTAVARIKRFNLFKKKSSCAIIFGSFHVTVSAVRFQHKLL